MCIRDSTEDVYAGIEYKAGTPEAAKLIAFLRDALGATVDASAAVGIKHMTAKGSKRLVRAAIRHALAQNLPSVTLVHKGNIMKFTEGAFRQHGYDVAKEEFAAQTVVEAEAASAPGKLVIKDRIADAMFQEALIRPEQYSVLATPNLNGDYISDALAAQVGGLGLAPGVNMSEKLAFFEATHGTAPSLAGKDRANPGSLILSGALMLEHIGWKEAATRIYKACLLYTSPSPIFLTCYNNSPSQLKRPGRMAAGIDLGGFSSMRAKKEYPAASSSGRCTVMSKGHAG